MPDANDFQTLHEIVKAARATVPDGPWDYLAGAAETETTVLRNRLAIDSLALRPRVLNNVRDIDCTSTLLGQRMRLPVFVAPMGSVQMLDPSAGLGLAKGAEQFGVTSFLSSTAAPGLEAVAAGSKGPKIFQLYVRGDLTWVEDHVRRAMAGGEEPFAGCSGGTRGCVPPLRCAGPAAPADRAMEIHRSARAHARGEAARWAARCRGQGARQVGRQAPG